MFTQTTMIPWTHMLKGLCLGMLNEVGYPLTSNLRNRLRSSIVIKSIKYIKIFFSERQYRFAHSAGLRISLLPCKLLIICWHMLTQTTMIPWTRTFKGLCLGIVNEAGCPLISIFRNRLRSSLLTNYIKYIKIFFSWNGSCV